MKKKNKKFKDEIIKALKKIDWIQVLINAAVIYMMCHLLLKLF